MWHTHCLALCPVEGGEKCHTLLPWHLTVIEKDRKIQGMAYALSFSIGLLSLFHSNSLFVLVSYPSPTFDDAVIIANIAHPTQKIDFLTLLVLPVGQNARRLLQMGFGTGARHQCPSSILPALAQAPYPKRYAPFSAEGV